MNSGERNRAQRCLSSAGVSPASDPRAGGTPALLGGAADNRKTRPGKVLCAPVASSETALRLIGRGNKSRSFAKAKTFQPEETAMPARTLKKLLDSRGVKYVSIEHSPAFTAPEIAASADVSSNNFAKTVIVKIDGDP